MQSPAEDHALLIGARRVVERGVIVRDLVLRGLLLRLAVGGSIDVPVYAAAERCWVAHTNLSPTAADERSRVVRQNGRLPKPKVSAAAAD